MDQSRDNGHTDGRSSARERTPSGPSGTGGRLTILINGVDLVDLAGCGDESGSARCTELPALPGDGRVAGLVPGLVLRDSVSNPAGPSLTVATARAGSTNTPFCTMPRFLRTMSPLHPPGLRRETTATPVVAGVSA
jgi:hypothetical protein